MKAASIWLVAVNLALVILVDEFSQQHESTINLTGFVECPNDSRVLDHIRTCRVLSRIEESLDPFERLEQFMNGIRTIGLCPESMTTPAY